MRNEEIVEVTVHEIKRALTILATFFFFSILVTVELSSCGLIVKRFSCFGSYAFDSYIGFKFI